MPRQPPTLPPLTGTPLDYVPLTQPTAKKPAKWHPTPWRTVLRRSFTAAVFIPLLAVGAFVYVVIFLICATVAIIGDLIDPEDWT